MPVQRGGHRFIYIIRMGQFIIADRYRMVENVGFNCIAFNKAFQRQYLRSVAIHTDKAVIAGTVYLAVFASEVIIQYVKHFPQSRIRLLCPGFIIIQMTIGVSHLNIHRSLPPLSWRQVQRMELSRVCARPG